MDSEFLQNMIQAEQNAAHMANLLSPYLSEFYKSMLAADFSEWQALELTKVVLRSTIAGGDYERD